MNAEHLAMDSSKGAIHTSFWTFNIGHLLTILVMGLGVLTAIFTFLDSIHELQHGQKSSNEAILQLSLRMDHMDATGTQASQKGIYQESETSKNVQHRVDMLEVTVSRMNTDMIPKLERMSANLEWLTSFVQSTFNKDSKSVPPPTPKS